MKNSLKIVLFWGVLLKVALFSTLLSSAALAQTTGFRFVAPVMDITMGLTASRINGGIALPAAVGGEGNNTTYSINGGNPLKHGLQWSGGTSPVEIAFNSVESSEAKSLIGPRVPESGEALWLPASSQVATYTATDGDGNVIEAEFRIVVRGPSFSPAEYPPQTVLLNEPVNITFPEAVPDAERTTNYRLTTSRLFSSGGTSTAPAQDDLNIPSELSFDTDTRTLSGTFTTVPAAPIDFYYVATDDETGKATLSFRMVVIAAESVPGMVENVDATPTIDAEDTSLDVSWDEPHNGGGTISRYEVQRSTSADFSSSPTITSTTPSAMVTGLTPSESYGVRVRAVNAMGPGPWSMTKFISTLSGPTSPPSAPTDFVVVTAPGTEADTDLTVTWTAAASNNADITNYELDYSTDAGFPVGAATASLAPAADAVSASITGRTPGTLYHVRLRAVNERGEGPYASTMVTTAAIPVAPGSFQVTRVPSSTNVRLTWTAPASRGSDITTYLVQYSTRPEFPNTGPMQRMTVTPAPTAADTSVTVEGLMSGTRYYFRIAAQTAVGLGSYAMADEMTSFAYPAAPLNFMATRDTTNPHNSVQLSWDALIPDAAGIFMGTYGVAHSTNMDFSGATTVAVEDETTHTVTGLAPNTLHYFRVRGEGVDSGSLTAGTYTTGVSVMTVPAPTAPDAPTDLVVVPTVANPTTGLTATWTASASDGGSTITLYRVSVALASDPNNALMTNRHNTAPFPVRDEFTGLSPGTSYIVTVVAVNAVGASTSATVTVSTLAPAAPNAPNSLAVAAGTPAHSALNVTWAAPTNPNGALTAHTGYRLEYTPAAGTTLTYTETTLNAGATSASITGLIPATTYTINLYAVNAQGDSDVATMDLATAAAPLTAGTYPAAPENVMAAPASVNPHNSVRISWDALLPDAAGTFSNDYEVSHSLSMDFATVLGVTQVADATADTVTGLMPSTLYYFRVSGAANSMNGANSEVVSVTTAAAPPGVPTNLTVAAGSPAHSALQVTWVAPASDGGSAITGYLVEYSAVAALASGIMTYTSARTSTAVTATVPSLSASTTYYFRVSAITAAATGSATAITSGTTGAAPAVITVSGPPTSFTAAAGSPSHNAIQVTWGAPASDGGSAITGYILEYSTVAGLASGVMTFSPAPVAGATSATVPGLSGSTTYYFRLRAVNGEGNSTPVTTSLATAAVPPAYRVRRLTSGFPLGS